VPQCPIAGDSNASKYLFLVLRTVTVCLYFRYIQHFDFLHTGVLHAIVGSAFSTPVVKVVLVPHFLARHFPPLHLGRAFSTSAFSV